MEGRPSRDTSVAAAGLQTRILRRMTGEERLKLAMDMCDVARGLAMIRLRNEHPAWSDHDLRRELVRYAFLPGPLPHELR